MKVYTDMEQEESLIV